MFKFFKRKDKKVANDNKIEDKEPLKKVIEERKSVKGNIDTILDKLFSNENFYTIVVIKNKVEEKYYQDILTVNNSKKEIFGFVFTEKKYAEKYIEDSFKNILPNLEAVVRKLKVDDIVEYSDKIKRNGGEGLIIDYSYFWGVLYFK